MSSGYLPVSDQELRNWVTNFATYAAANSVALGIVAGDVTPISTAETAFAAKLDAQTAEKAATKSATQAKDTSRTTLKTAVRALVKRLQASTIITNAQRAALGITVSDGSRTPVAAPTSRPIVSVWVSQGLRQEIRFADENTPTRKRKPDGVRGAEVWVKILNPGEAPPADAAGMTFLDVSTSSPYLAEFSGDNAGKTAWYRLRWVNTRGEKGPWSDLASGTIAG
jgi:hypothetical protein